MKYLQTNISLKILFCLTLFFLGLMSASVTYAETETYSLDSIWGKDSVRLNSITGLGVDPNGIVYVGEQGLVKKLSDPQTVIQTFGVGELNHPADFAFGSNGIVYIADDNRIVKYTSDGTFTGTIEIYGTEHTQLGHLSGVAVDSSNNVYVADSWYNRIVKFDSNGDYVTEWGQADSGDYSFNAPSGIAIDSQNFVYVADMDNNRIQKFNSDGIYIGTISSYLEKTFNYPSDVAVDSYDNVYVVDSHDYSFVKYNSKGAYVTQWGTFGLDNASIFSPQFIAIDSQSGKVFVTDSIIDPTVPNPGDPRYRIPVIKVFVKPKVLATVLAIDPTIGSENTDVYIHGSGFTAATGVDFGDIPATYFEIVSDDLIIASAPKGSGTVDVRVITLDGLSEISPNAQFTYLTVPVIDHLSSTSGPAAGNNIVTIYGSGFNEATSVFFGDTQIISANFISADDGQITVTVPAGSGTVDVLVRKDTYASNSVYYTYINSATTIDSLSPTSGPASGGNTVTIYGSGFTGATTVAFGNVQINEFTIQNDGQIDVTVPAGSGKVDVSVIGSGGVRSNSVQYTYLPVPNIGSLSSTSGPAAGGTTINIFGSGFMGATTVVFGYTQINEFTIQNDGQIDVTVPAGSGTVDVSVIGPGGISNSVKYTYLPVPTVSSLNPNSGTNGITVTITGKYFTGATRVKFGTADATGFTVKSDTQITATVPAGSGKVDVTVTTPGGTSAVSKNIQYTYKKK